MARYDLGEVEWRLIEPLLSVQLPVLPVTQEALPPGLKVPATLAPAIAPTKL